MLKIIWIVFKFKFQTSVNYYITVIIIEFKSTLSLMRITIQKKNLDEIWSR